MTQSDSIQFRNIILHKDSAGIEGIPESRVFIEENADHQHGIPFSVNLDRNLPPDWILFFTLAILAFVAWINLVYPRSIEKLFQSSVNYQSSLRIYNDPNIVQKRINGFFSTLYYMSTALFFFVLYQYFKLDWLPYGQFGILLIIIGFLILLAVLRILIYRFTGLVFDRFKVFQEALFHNFIYNKLTGIMVLPFVLLITYTRNIYMDVSVYLGLTLFLGIFLLRIIRAGIFVSKNVVSYFYFILYLCTLEIIPFLVIIKLILYLAKVS